MSSMRYKAIFQVVIRHGWEGAMQMNGMNE